MRDDDVIRIDLRRTAVPAGRDVLLLSDVVLRNGVRVDAHLRGPDRVAVVGPNGSGKTTLIDTITGTIPAVAGRVDLRVPVRVLPQRLTVLDDAETVLAGVSRLAPSADDNTLRAELARFLLDADTVVRPVGSLSGGERFRASLAALLLAEPAPQLLILDEPTNNLDLDSVAQLTAALNAYQGALLVISHDEPFLADLAPDRPPRPQHLTRHRHPDRLTRLRVSSNPRGVDGCGCDVDRVCSSPRGVGSRSNGAAPRSSPPNIQSPTRASQPPPVRAENRTQARAVWCGEGVEGPGWVWREPEPARADGCPRPPPHTRPRTQPQPATGNDFCRTIPCGRLARVAY